MPTDFKLTEDKRLQITWNDDRVTTYEFQFLRGNCPCAECVSEETGERLVFPADIPENIRPMQANPVGRYAYQIIWSDGHKHGLFSYDYLLTLSQQSSA